MISIIVAVAKNGVIGKSNKLPWYLPAELAYFRQKTLGHPIIMGRLTHESIGRVLPGRTNIVLDKSGKKIDGAVVAGSIEDAIEAAKQAEGNDEIFFIGGASVYEQVLPLTDRLYLTDVKADIDGDKFFKYDPGEWHETWSEKHAADELNKYDFVFRILDRKR